MKLFIRYRSYRSQGRRNINLCSITQGLPTRYVKIVTLHWDCSCRPDPDFDPQFPSTALCRSPTIQKFITRNFNAIIYYFYTFTVNSQKLIAITAKLKPIISFCNHQSAYNWFLNRRSNNDIPLNIVVDSNGSYRPCTKVSHKMNAFPDSTYYSRLGNPVIIFKWLCNRTIRPIIITESSFLQALNRKNATLINSNNNFSSLNQLQNSAIVLQ